jgi:hypothetical protein
MSGSYTSSSPSASMTCSGTPLLFFYTFNPRADALAKCVSKKHDVSTDWIHLAQNTVQQRALMNTVMNLWISYKMGKFL